MPSTAPVSLRDAARNSSLSRNAPEKSWTVYWGRAGDVATSKERGIFSAFGSLEEEVKKGNSPLLGTLFVRCCPAF